MHRSMCYIGGMKLRLKTILNERGWTPHRLAAEVDPKILCRRQVYNLVEGKALPRLDRAFHLAAVLGVEVEALVSH